MIDEEIKKLIKKVENLLKSDERFMKNEDYLYKKHMKKINKETKNGITTIPFFQQPITMNMPLPKVITKEVVREVPKVVTKEVIRLLPFCPNKDTSSTETKTEEPPQPRRSISTEMSSGLSSSRGVQGDEIQGNLDEIYQLIDQFNLDELNRRLAATNQQLQDLIARVRE
jgi:hypothetical protein